MASTDTADRFGFGANWADYIEKNFSKDRLDISKTHLLEFLKLSNLEGKTFLDIGCGSGLHSLAAYESGAKSVFSFDFDKNSVATTKKLHAFAGSPNNWTISQGSVLDAEFMQTIPKADIVYSWGVLHHTGSMWEAINNAAIPMHEDSIFCIALYTTDVYIDPTPEYWLKIKRQYNDGGELRKRFMEWRYAYRQLIAPRLKRLENPLRVIRDYKQTRGMSYWTDVRDWLGGWPMEFAGIEETKVFCRDKLGLEMLNINAGEANTEYVFRRHGANNYWDDVLASKEIIPMTPRFKHHGGSAWFYALDNVPVHLSDDKEHPKRSKLMLFENGVPVGFAHMPVAHVEQYGGSRYLHGKEGIYFSTMDNSDPNDNGRSYSYCLDW